MFHFIPSSWRFVLVLPACLSFSLFAEEASGSGSSSQNTAKPGQEFPLSVLQAASSASQSWLGLLDRNRYGESWDKASSWTKLTIRKDEWVALLEKTRRPFGGVISREVLDERTAIDPPGMPRGNYIVMFYKTVFSHKTGHELVTLYLEDGKWAVLTYQVDSV